MAKSVCEYCGKERNKCGSAQEQNGESSTCSTSAISKKEVRARASLDLRYEGTLK